MDNNVGASEASVVILTYNGAAYLDEVLERVMGQKAPFKYDVLVIDSGSKDETLKIANRFTGRDGRLRIIEIPPSEFNHGDTRNLGVRETNGKFVAFLTQDATPADDNWLASIRACFDMDKDIAAVFGKHIPRADCNPITKRDINGVFLNISPDGTAAIQEEGGNGFYSDVNSCLRRDYWEKHPYTAVDYAEDQIFGRDVLLNGYKKAYCPDAAVYHSHDYPPREFAARYFDEYRGLKKAVGFKDQTGFIKLVPSAARGAVRDFRMVVASGAANELGRRYWAIYAWRMNYARAKGAYFGGRYESLPGWLARRMSLEEKNKGKQG